jgi:hypothetical protein
MIRYLLATIRWGDTLTDEDLNVIDNVTFWQLFGCPRPYPKTSKSFSNLSS